MALYRLDTDDMDRLLESHPLRAGREASRSPPRRPSTSNDPDPTTTPRPSEPTSLQESESSLSSFLPFKKPNMYTNVIVTNRTYKAIVSVTAKSGYRADLRASAVARASAIRQSQVPKKDSPGKKLRGAKARKAAAEKDE